MKKRFFIIISILVLCAWTSNALAWEITLGDIYDSSGYKAVDISFAGEATDNLNDLFVSLAYDATDLEILTVVTPSYDNGAPFPLTETTWEGSPLPYDDSTPGLITEISGGEPLDNQFSFFPVATGQTLLATVWFSETGAADNDSVWFTYGADATNGMTTDVVSVNGVSAFDHDLVITADTISTVPVPAAVWLLGSGLLGVIGVRRKKQR